MSKNTRTRGGGDPGPSSPDLVVPSSFSASSHRKPSLGIISYRGNLLCPWKCKSGCKRTVLLGAIVWHFLLGSWPRAPRPSAAQLRRAWDLPRLQLKSTGKAANSVHTQNLGLPCRRYGREDLNSEPPSQALPNLLIHRDYEK